MVRAPVWGTGGPQFKSAYPDVTRFKEVARDVSPLLMIIAFLVLICILVMGVLGIFAKDAIAGSADGSTPQPSGYEVLEQNLARTIFTFCDRGNRFWVVQSGKGDVAMTSQPGHGC